MPLPRLYLITDRSLVPAARNFLEILEELMAAGIRMIQLREKDLPANDLYQVAKELRAVTRRYDCLLLINDRVDIAQAVDADGVHLRHNSIPTASARKLLGDTKLIGVSTHSDAEIVSAAAQGANFTTFGPIFFTPSKASLGFPKGLPELRKACCSSPIPVYALGGITVANTPATMVTGAYGIATISSLMASNSPTKTCRKLMEAINH